MSRAAFDKKFGADFCDELPTGPGVYRYWDANGKILYVGKAKNLRRRLQGYRNASAKKAHRKMRSIVREAARLTFEELPSEEAALLLETQLIQELRPPYNIEGAYSFLYPAFGVGTWDAHLLVCFTTEPEQFGQLDLSWFGAFRSRPRAKEALEALIELLDHLGHREQRNRLPKHPRIRGSRLLGFRQVPIEVQKALPWFLAGTEPTLLSEMSQALLHKPSALHRPAEVQTALETLKNFYQQDCEKLRLELQSVGQPGSFIAGDERDLLTIRSNFSAPNS